MSLESKRSERRRAYKALRAVGLAQGQARLAEDRLDDVRPTPAYHRRLHEMLDAFGVPAQGVDGEGVDDQCPECGVGRFVEHDPGCPTQGGGIDATEAGKS